MNQTFFINLCHFIFGEVKNERILLKFEVDKLNLTCGKILVILRFYLFFFLQVLFF